MKSEMIKNIKEDIRKRCESPNNFFGVDIYAHIESVAKNAIELAKLNNADVEVCEIAGWLHDIAAITEYSLYEHHHIYGANMAEEILKSYNYPKDKIALVKLCILNHRGSVPKEKITKEEICVADADAMSHLETIPSLLYMAFVKKNLNVKDGVEFVKNKIDRSYQKMSKDSQDYYKDKKDLVIKILG